MLAACAAVGMGLTGAMAWQGGALKLYNDIPSLVGYLSLALCIYRLGIRPFTRFCIMTSGVGYEWYLTHSLVFSIVRHGAPNAWPAWAICLACLMASYAIAFLYHGLVTSVRRWVGRRTKP